MHVLKNWNLNANEKIKRNEDARDLVYYGIKNIMYMSIDFEETQEHFIELANEVVLDIFDEVKDAKKSFKSYIWSFYGRFGA